MIDLPFFPSARKLLMAAVLATATMLLPTLTHAQDDPPQVAGRISYVQGAVSVQPVGLDQWGQAEANLPLGPGDRVFTDVDSTAEIQVGRTYVRLGPNTDVSIVEINPDSISIGIGRGEIHVHCFNAWPGQRIHIDTPSGTATLIPGSELRVDVDPNAPSALFTQVASVSFLNGAGGFGSHLQQGTALELAGTNPVVPQWLDPAAFDSLDQWSQMRDRQIEASTSYRYVSPDVGGAYELDASGQWNPESPYGPMWFPNVQAGWAPYHNGHWVSHAPWGWTWVEAEPWGYAPFHYGRWVVFNGRWGWIPGPVESHPVWSPALVVFAGGINVGGVGVSAWFPLGPGEPYRPWYPCSPRYIDAVNVSNLRPAPGIHILVSYAGFNFGAAVFANQRVGITAISHADFAAGRPVRETNVVVNVNIINHITVIERPVEAPNPRIFVTRAPARPVPVPVERPALINESGMVVSAKVGFKPAPPPVTKAPEVHIMPGHKAVSAPPGSSIHEKPEAPAAVPAKPAAPAAAGAKPPAAAPGTAKPAPKPETEQGGKPTAAPDKPAQKDVAKPGTKPADKDKDKNKNKDDKKDEKPN